MTFTSLSSLSRDIRDSLLMTSQVLKGRELGNWGNFREVTLKGGVVTYRELSS